MKKLILIALLPFIFAASNNYLGKDDPGSINGKANDTIASVLGVTFTQAVGATYLVSEDFEGTGYEETWTESGGGTIDEDYTTTVLVGSQSLGITNAVGQLTNSVITTFTAQDSVYCYLRFRMSAANVQREVIGIQDGSSNSLCYAQIMSNNVLRMTSNASVETVGTLAANTEYHLWVRYSKGTGGNAVCSGGFSTDGTEPTSGDNFVSKTNGTATAQGEKVFVGGYANSTSIVRIFDKVRVKTTSIGDNPE